MSNNFQYDGSVSVEQDQAIEADQQESLQIGNDLETQQQQLLAGKYKSAEDLEKGYLELQKLVGQNQSNEVQPTSSLSDKLSEAFDSYNSDKKFNVDAFENVSKEDLIKAFFENSEEVPQTAENTSPDLTDNQVNQIKQRVGGEKQYTDMMKWAVQNLPKSDMDSFDAIVDSGNTTTIAMAVDAMAKRYTDANGQEGRMLQGRSSVNNNVYRSQAEMLRDMNDQRYDNDPAYRNDVMVKLQNSPNLQF